MTYAELPKLKKNSISTALSSGITDSDVTIPVTELSVFYDADSNLITKGIVIGYDASNDTYAEEITITGASGTSGAGNLTGATRGVKADGSIGAARAWDSGTNIAVMFSTGIYEQIKDNDTAIFDALYNPNVIINPSFRINQRGYISAATLASGVYGHDRWKAGVSGGDYTFTQAENSTTITIGSGKSLIQVVENKNVYGGSYVLSWTGTATARYGVDSATPSGSYAASPIIITGQTSGTVMSVEFTDGTLKDVQLVSGSEELSFNPRSIGEELMLCLRYYRSILEVGGVSIESSGGTGTYNSVVYTFSVPMRIVPTIVLIGTFDTINCGNPSVFYSSQQYVIIGVSASGTMPVRVSCISAAGSGYTADAEL
jgi:hypothetical protein